MDRRLLKTAYHEAGHAVISLRLGIKFKYATIVSNEKHDSLGHVKGKNPRWFKSEVIEERYKTKRRQDWIFNNIIILYAGEEGQRLLTGRSDNVSTRFDRESILMLALSVTQSDEEALALMKWLRIRTRLLVEAPANSITIAGVAQALMEGKTLTEAQVREVKLATLQAAMGPPPEIQCA